jgi:hypothetical protein
MSRILGFGVAVALCAVGAGFGAYLALRPAAAVVSSPEPGLPVSPDVALTSATTQAPAAAGTENVIADTPAPAPATPAAAVPEPGKATARPPAPKPASKPADSPAPAASQVPATTPATAPAPDPGWTGVDKTWPSGTATATTGAPPITTLPTFEPPAALPPAPEPPKKVFEELVVAADAVLGLQLDSSLSSEVAKVEDPVDARVTRDVKVGQDIAIPAGTRVIGSVVQVERGGKMKDRARLGVRFHTLVMADGSRLPINTDAIFREGKSPGQESAAKVGAAAVGGAILGAIIGGGKGAAIGGSIGAAGGAAATMAGGRNPATLAAGTAVTVRLQQPVTITVERQQ